MNLPTSFDQMIYQTDATKPCAWVARLLVVILLLVGFWLRMDGLGKYDFWTDEAVSVMHARTANSGAFFESLQTNEGMPPLYFALLRAWGGLGETELMLRVLSVWLSIVALALIYRLGVLYFDLEVGVLAVAILALSSMHILLSKWARPYALSLTVVIWLSLLILRLERKPSRAGWVLWTVAATIAIYTLYILGAFLVGLGLYLILKRRRLGFFRALGPVAGAGVATLVLFVPWLPKLFAQMDWAPSALWWVSPPAPRMLVETLDQFVFGAELQTWPAAAVLTAVPFLTAILLIWSLSLRQDQPICIRVFRHWLPAPGDLDGFLLAADLSTSSRLVCVAGSRAVAGSWN